MSSSCSVRIFEEYQDGVGAYERKDYKTAHRIFLKFAEIVDIDFYTNTFARETYQITHSDPYRVIGFLKNERNWKTHFKINRVTGYYNKYLDCFGKDVVDKKGCLNHKDMFPESEGICRVAERKF